MADTISIANLPTWTPSTDDILVFVDRADWVTKRANQDEFPSSWTGDVTWPASSTDNALARMDWTTGKVIQNSTVTLSDTGDIAGVNEIQVVELRASTSAGVDVHNNSGTQVAIFGAGWSTWSTLVGTTNVGSASADYHQLSGGTGTITDTATGSSTNININVVPKWTGRFQSGWVNVPTVSSTDTMTNKTMTGATNTLTASVLKSATTEVNVSSATAPTSGQVLTATSSTAATWQTPSGWNTCSFGVRIWSNQTISTGTATLAQFNTELFDTNWDFNSWSYRFVAPSNWVYIITGNTMMNVNHRTMLYKNWSVYLNLEQNLLTWTGNQWICNSINFVMSLATSDYLEIYVSHTSWSNQTLYSGTSSWFSGAKIQ